MPLNAGISVDASRRPRPPAFIKAKGKSRSSRSRRGAGSFAAATPTAVRETRASRGIPPSGPSRSWWFTEEVYKSIVEVYHKSGGGYLTRSA